MVNWFWFKRSRAHQNRGSTLKITTAYHLLKTALWYWKVSDWNCHFSVWFWPRTLLIKSWKH